MEKKIFTPEFYKQLYDNIMDDIADMEDGTNYYESVIGGVTVSVSVLVDVTVEDRSFSHAFGVKEEYACVNSLADIADVEVWDCNGDDVEGFSMDDFNEQFMSYMVRLSGGTVRKGDRVVAVFGYNSPVNAEFVCYDTLRKIFTVIVDGKRCKVRRVKAA